jgi:hypothetical protein
MPNTDLQKWASRAGINPPGGFVGVPVASSTTITPTGPIFHVTGTSTITTIVPPFTGFIGKLTIIADGAFVLNTGGTAGSAIGTAVTAVASQAMDLVFDGSTWYPHIMD